MMNTSRCCICDAPCGSQLSQLLQEKCFDICGIMIDETSAFCYICHHLIDKLWNFRNSCLHKLSMVQLLDTTFKCPHRITIKKVSFNSSICQNTNICHTTFDDQFYMLELETEKLKYDTGSLHNEELIGHDCDDVQGSEDIFSTNFSDTSNEKDDNYTLKSTHFDENTELTRTNDNDSESLETNDPNDPSLAEDTTKIVKPHFIKTILTFEEQKSELESKRKSKEYIEAKHKCYSCAQTFSMKDSYLNHMVRHEESNGAWCCVVCGLRFASRAGLSNHAALHAARLRCGACGEELAGAGGSARRTHLASCRARQHDSSAAAACHHCGKLFADERKLQQHGRRAHSSRPAPRLSCLSCGNIYRSATALRKHLLSHGSQRFPCASCGAAFKSPYALAQHGKRHARAEHEPRHYCARCDRFYASRKTYKQHLTSSLNHRAPRHECFVCGRGFSRSSALAEHRAARHGAGASSGPGAGPSGHRCAECGASFATRAYLRKHQRRHRAAPAPAAGTAAATAAACCHYCGKLFHDKGKLTRHIVMVCEGKHSRDVYLALAASQLQPELAQLQPALAQDQPTLTELQPSYTQLQPTLTHLQPTLSHLQPTLTLLQPTHTQLQPNLTQLQPTLTQLQPTLTQLQPTLTQLQPTHAQLQPTLAQLEPTLTQLQPALNQLQPSLAPLPDALYTLEST